MWIRDAQIDKLRELYNFNKEVKKEVPEIESSQNTYKDMMKYLHSKPYHDIFDKINNIQIRISGYLFLKSGHICPLIFNHTYMLRPLQFNRRRLSLSDDTAGLIYSQSGSKNISEKVKTAIYVYNRKVDLTVSEYPRSKHLFENKSIFGFKLL